MYRVFIETGRIDPVVRYLNEMSFRTTRGNPCQRTTVRRILVKPTYKGAYHHRDFEFSVPPIVDLETWSRTNEILSNNEWTVASKALELHWELSGGIGKCGVCGRNLTAQSREIGSKKYYYYYCDGKSCPNNKYSRAEELEMVGIGFLQDFYSETSTFWGHGHPEP